MLRITMIEENKARLFGTELFGSVDHYSEGRLLTSKHILPMYVTVATPSINQNVRENEIFWKQEPDTRAFASKWEQFLRPMCLAVEATERVLTSDAIGHATWSVQVETWLRDHILHVKVDPASQTPKQKEALSEHFTQNTPIRVLAYDAQESILLLFHAVILNVEHSNRGHVVGYHLKREVPYSLTKEIPKPKVARPTKAATQPPQYEGLEAETSGDECIVTGDVVIVRKRRTPCWPGLEKGVPVAFNAPHDTDAQLFRHYGFPPFLTLAADASLKQIDSLTASIRHIEPIPGTMLRSIRR